MCLTLCDPIDCSPPGSSIHGILQARTLGWIAIFFSRDLPDPGIDPGSPALQADSLTSEPPGKPPMIIGRLQIDLVDLVDRVPEELWTELPNIQEVLQGGKVVI